jgi:hypothetical protein
MQQPTVRGGCRCARPFAVLLPFVLTSCFTMGLWGFTADDDDAGSGGCDPSYSYDPATQWSWGLLCLRVLVTPLTLCLDCLTAPLQSCCDDPPHHKHHHCHCH